MSRGAPLGIVVVAALGLSACESSQTRSARLRAAATTRTTEQGLRIDKPLAGVRVEAATIVNDEKAGRSAAIVELRNTSTKPLAGLPLLLSVKGADGKQVFSNGSPGASADLTTVPSLDPGATLAWVDDAIVGVKGARTVDARVGAPPAPVPGAAPRMRLSAVALDRDPVDGITASGRVFNPSPVAQERLVIFATARRGSKIVAAGRAVVPLVRPGAAGARFTIFFVGDPTGAKLRLQAPAVSLKGTR
jgi:hypothetical protein